MSRYFLKLFPVLFIVIAIGCNTTKRAARKAEKETEDTTASGTITIDTTVFTKEPTPPPPPPDVPAGFNPALTSQLVELWNREIAYTTFTGKAKMHYEGMGMKHDFTANIRMAKDSVIWVHVSAGMGLVNVARILITPDSFQLVNYLDKSVMLKDIKDINSVMPAPVDFSILQNLISGEVLIKKGEAKAANKIDEMLYLTMLYENLQQRAVFSEADKTLRVLSMMSLDDEHGMTGFMKYDGYTMVDGINFAASRVVNVGYDGKPNLLEMNFTSASFNQSQSYPFSIPDSYTKK